MAIFAEIRRRARYVVGPALALCAVFYFVYHVVHGDRGLFAWHRLNGDIEQARAELDGLRHHRQVTEHRVRLLRPDGVDIDLLDEMVRRNLGYGRSDEIIITTPPLVAGPTPED